MCDLSIPQNVGPNELAWTLNPKANKQNRFVKKGGS